MTRAAKRFGLVLLAAACAGLSAFQAEGQEVRGPVRPDAPSAERPEAPAPPEAASETVAPAPAPAAREPVTYWDEYQRALDEAASETDAAPAPDSAEPEAAEAPPTQGVSPFDEAETGPRSFQDNLLRVVFWLCILMAAFLMATYFIRTLGQRARLIPADSLATVIGRVYLAPRYSLHFVRTGGRVLVVGVTPTSMNPIAEFEDDAFPRETSAAASNGAKRADDAPAREKAVRFLDELKQHQRKMTAPESAGGAPKSASGGEDEEIVSLRGDIARLQQLLRDAPHDPPR